jgi:hypothetical protein
MIRVSGSFTYVDQEGCAVIQNGSLLIFIKGVLLPMKSIDISFYKAGY